MPTKQLFNFLADEVGKMTTTNEVIVTREENVLTSSSHLNTKIDGLAPCTHEEAATWIFLHAWNAAKDGHKSLMIEANDTDIIVIALSLVSSFTAMGMEKMWVAYGKGKHSRWIPIHDLASSFTFSRCDVVSVFNGKGKKLHGRHGMFSIMPQLHLRNSVSVLQKLMSLIYKH